MSEREIPVAGFPDNMTAVYHRGQLKGLSRTYSVRDDSAALLRQVLREPFSRGLLLLFGVSGGCGSPVCWAGPHETKLRGNGCGRDCLGDSEC